MKTKDRAEETVKERTELVELVGTRWKGRAELWLDPLGNEWQVSECTIDIEPGAVRYTWVREAKTHEGSLVLHDDRADFSDSWHHPAAMPCRKVAGSWALLEVTGTYEVNGGPEWGWRTALSLRTPTGELVLQMTNVCPWGEDGRAVRMVCSRV